MPNYLLGHTLAACLTLPKNNLRSTKLLSTTIKRARARVVRPYTKENILESF